MAAVQAQKAGNYDEKMDGSGCSGALDGSSRARRRRSLLKQYDEVPVLPEEVMS